MATHGPQTGEFAFLTPKQKAVLDLLADHRTSKEIAHSLGVTETSVNRRIEIVKLRLGGITRLEVARRYRHWRGVHGGTGADVAAETGESGRSPCVETIGDILHLAEKGDAGERADRDSGASETAFKDPVAMSIEAPWKQPSEPRVVPGVLDGENATLTRGAAIAVLLFAIVASIVVALAAAKALADAVS